MFEVSERIAVEQYQNDYNLSIAYPAFLCRRFSVRQEEGE